MTCLLKPLVEQAILPLSKLLYGFFMLSLAAPSTCLSASFIGWKTIILYFLLIQLSSICLSSTRRERQIRITRAVGKETDPIAWRSQALKI